MCGIAGIVSAERSFSKQDIEPIIESIKHRGPDGQQYWQNENKNVSLIHTRLSILDLSSNSDQPMSIGNYTMVFNGEVFNFIELREELKSLGHSFRTTGDSEVVLKAFIQWGEACLSKFNGMWALAIFNKETNELFLARDRYGIKPLYYLKESKYFAFSSETNTFKYLPNYNRTINQNNLEFNILNPYGLEGKGRTIFNNVYQLLPGHFAIVKGVEIKTKRWYNIIDRIATKPKPLKHDEFYNLIQESVALRLRSDVPIATALSGGLDSSSIFTIVNKVLQDSTSERISNKKQQAFVATFPGTNVDEAAYANDVVKHYNQSAINIDVAAGGNLFNELTQSIINSDFVLPTPITAISKIYESMRNNGYVVSLDGHGVDEMLYGYRNQVYDLMQNFGLDRKKTKALSMLGVLKNMYHPESRNEIEERYGAFIHSWHGGIKGKIKSLIKSLPIKQNRDQTQNLPWGNDFDSVYDFSSFEYHDQLLLNEFFVYSLPTLLRNFDKASMLNGVEIRMPFMDYRVVEAVFSMPFEQKIGEGYTKLALRKAISKKLPKQIVNRTYKIGIQSPLEVWGKSILKQPILDTLNSKDFKTYDLKIESFNEQNLANKLIKNEATLPEIQSFLLKYSSYLLSKQA